jgi:hypothetical protein
MGFYETFAKVSKIKIGKLKEVYTLAKELWSSLDEDQKSQLSVALMQILTPEQLVKGTELYGLWKELWKKEKSR